MSGPCLSVASETFKKTSQNVYVQCSNMYIFIGHLSVLFDCMYIGVTVEIMCLMYICIF